MATQSEGYPGWKPDMASPVLGRMKQIHERVMGKPAAIKAIHAGLECGVLGAKLPGCDMISFGPLLEGVHAPGERVNIPSVARFWLKDGVVDLAPFGSKVTKDVQDKIAAAKTKMSASVASSSQGA